MGLDATPLAERRRATELLRASGVTITSQRTSSQSRLSSYRMHMSRAIGSSLNSASRPSSLVKAQGTTGAGHGGTGAYTARNSTCTSASDSQPSSSVVVSGSGSSSGTSGTFKTAIEDSPSERPFDGVKNSSENLATPVAPQPQVASVSDLRSERRKTELFVDPTTGWRSIRTSPSSAARATQAQGSAIV